MRLSTPLIVADILGATTFLVLALFYAFKDDDKKLDYTARRDIPRAQIFALLFTALSISVAIVLAAK